MAIKELFQDSRPQVLFDPRASQRIDPRFKFTRNGLASYYDSDGLLRVMAAPINQPRVGFNYEPDENGVMQPAGLLLEGSKTNLFDYSVDVNQWTGSSWSATPNSITAPDGTLTGGKVVPIVGTTFQQIGRSVSWTSGVTYSVSFFAKDAGMGKVQVHCFNQINRGEFDLVNGTSTIVTTGLSTSITPFPNGWYRCVYIFTADSTTTGVAALRIPTDYTPNGVEGVYAWGFQVEASPYPTSYIPTSGSEVTRDPDLLSIEGTSLPSTGSIYIDARSLSSDVDDTLLSAANASNDKLTLAIREPANLYNSKALVYEVDGAFKPTLPFPVPTDARERNLITYGANNYHYRSDSARLTPSSSTSVPAGMNRLGIGHDVTDPTKAFTGYINTLYLWPGEITPTVAEALVRGDVDPKDADAGVFTPEAGALAFVFNTQGTGTDGNRVVELPVSGSTNNILVDWGDNTSSSFIGAAASSTVSHTYPSAGIYPVQITADDDGTNSGLENLNFYNSSQRLDLVRVLQWGGTTTWQPTTMYRAFYGCTQLDFENAARTNLPDTSAITNWQEAFYNCSSISGTFPTFNTSAAMNFASAWGGCSSLTAFPFINSSNGTTFNAAWQGCSNLTSFPLIDTSSSTSFVFTWSGCSSLASFPLIDTSSATALAYAWSACSSLTSFPLIDTSNVTSFDVAWSGCSGLTSFPLIDTSSATSFDAAWFYCSSLTSFPLLNSATVTNFNAAWFACFSLTSFPLINTAAGTNFNSAWYGCSGLTSFPLINTAAGTDFTTAWYACSSLTSFPLLNTAAGTNFYLAWYNCSSLTDFPASFFDLWTGTPVNRCFHNTWGLCYSLTPSSVVNILDSIAASGQSAPSGTGTDDKKITIDWDGTGDPATDAAAAITTLKSRNWVIVLNGVTQ